MRFLILILRCGSVCLMVLPTMFDTLSAMTCYGKTNYTETRKCMSFCSETNCPSYCICVSDKVYNSCSHILNIPNNTIILKETITPGTTILSMNSSGTDSWELALLRYGAVDGSIWNHLSSYFLMNKIGSVYEIIVNKSPDLEDIFDRYAIKLTKLVLSLTCKISTYTDEKHQITIEILPVNEFAPEFSETTLVLNVPEDIKAGSVVYVLINHTVDLDVNPYGPELGIFNMTNYLINPMFDGKRFFKMQDFTIGSIVLQHGLDFEALKPLNATHFFLNVSASDVHNLTKYTVLTVNIVDVDDLPPEFYHPGCPVVSVRSRPCLVSYEALLQLKQIGPLTDIVPSPIQARDMDTLNSAVEFSLELAPGEKLANLLHFSINKTTGEIRVTAPFLKNTEINLVVVANERSFSSRATQASLHVVIEDKRSGLSAFNEEDTFSESSGLNDVLVRHGGVYVLTFLVISLILITCLVVLLVVMCLRLRKFKKTKRSIGPVEQLKGDTQRPVAPNGPMPSPWPLARNGGQDAGADYGVTKDGLNRNEKSEESSQNQRALTTETSSGQAAVMSTLGNAPHMNELSPVAVHGRGQLCFNDNRSSAAFVAYYFNDGRGGEFQEERNIVSAQCIVPIERKEMWRGQIRSSREDLDASRQNLHMNRKDTLMDEDLRSLEFHCDQLIRRDTGMSRNETVSSESSTSLYNKYATLSDEHFSASPSSRQFTPRDQRDRAGGKLQRCTAHGVLRRNTNALNETPFSMQESLSETLRSIGSGTMTDRFIQEVKPYSPDPQSISANTANILSIIPVDQPSFMCASEESCSRKAQDNEVSTYNHSFVRNKESPAVCARRRESQVLKSTSFGHVTSSRHLQMPTADRRELNPDLTAVALHRKSRICRSKPKTSITRKISEPLRPKTFQEKSRSLHSWTDTSFRLPSTCPQRPQLSGIYTANVRANAITEIYGDGQTTYRIPTELNARSSSAGTNEIMCSNVCMPGSAHANVQGEQNFASGHAGEPFPQNPQVLIRDSKLQVTQSNGASSQKETRPYTYPKETHACESLIAGLRNRPWTSDNFSKAMNSGAERRNLTVPRNGSAAQKPQSPQRIISGASNIYNTQSKRESTSVSQSNVRKLQTNEKQPRWQSRLKKKRLRKIKNAEADRHGDELRPPQTALQQSTVRHWPSAIDLPAKLSSRRLPSLDQTGLQDFPRPRPLSLDKNCAASPSNETKLGQHGEDSNANKTEK